MPLQFVPGVPLARLKLSNIFVEGYPVDVFMEVTVGVNVGVSVEVPVIVTVGV